MSFFMPFTRVQDKYNLEQRLMQKMQTFKIPSSHFTFEENEKTSSSDFISYLPNLMKLNCF